MGTPNGNLLQKHWLPPGEAYIKRAGGTDNPAPADLARHGGYGVVAADGAKLLGPFAYYENAAREAQKHSGRVVRFRDFLPKAAKTAAPSLRETDLITEAQRARK